MELNSFEVSRYLHRNLRTFFLDTLELQNTAEIVGAGGFGSIHLGTIEWRPASRNLDTSVLGSFTSYLGQSCRLVVAVKKVLLSEQEDILELVREASNLRVLRGARNAVNVYGVVRIRQYGLRGVSYSNWACIVMDLLKGPHLNRFLRNQRRRCSSSLQWWKMKLEIFMELVTGLSRCHQVGVYHGDIKGENVIVDDKLLVPKLIDFGMSFRRKDASYLTSSGGSAFWVCPEIYDAGGVIPVEVLENPYPSDIYSLGMLLVEMFLDGNIPELDDNFFCDKISGGSPIQLGTPDDMEACYGPVFSKLSNLADGCCSLERQDRISLETCLRQVQEAYSQLCSIGAHCLGVPIFSDDNIRFTSTSEYRRIMQALDHVPECILSQPSKNMVVDVRGNSLLHLFCEMDFAQGVEFILDKWIDFIQQEQDFPDLCNLAVRGGRGLQVLKLLKSRWKQGEGMGEGFDQVVEVLIHEACDGENVAILQFLLSSKRSWRQDDQETWHREEHLRPSHKLAYHGKLEMLEVLLSHIKAFPGIGYGDMPLEYAIQGDQWDTVMFLVGRGIRLAATGSNLPQDLFDAARRKGSLKVMVGLLEANSAIYTAANASLSYDSMLQVLKDHLVASSRSGLTPFAFGCHRGNETVLEVLISFYDHAASLPDEFWSDLGAHCSKQMASHVFSTLEGAHLYVKKVWNAALQLQNSHVLENSDVTKQLSQPVKEETPTSPVEGTWENTVTRYQYQYHLLTRAWTATPTQKLARACCQHGNLDGLGDIERGLKGAELRAMQVDSLLEASYLGQMAVVKYLLPKVGVHGNNLHTPNYLVPQFGQPLPEPTPLFMALEGQHYELAVLLLESGAFPDLRVYDGYTCMDPVLRHNNRKLARLLVNSGMKNRHNEVYMDLVANMNNDAELE